MLLCKSKEAEQRPGFGTQRGYIERVGVFIAGNIVLWATRMRFTEPKSRKLKAILNVHVIPMIMNGHLDLPSS